MDVYIKYTRLYSGVTSPHLGVAIHRPHGYIIPIWAQESACSCAQAPADVLVLWQWLCERVPNVSEANGTGWTGWPSHFPLFTSLNYNKQRSSFQWRATRRRTQSFWRRETRDRPRVMGNLCFLGQSSALCLVLRTFGQSYGSAGNMVRWQIWKLLHTLPWGDKISLA